MEDIYANVQPVKLIPQISARNYRGKNDTTYRYKCVSSLFFSRIHMYLFLIFTVSSFDTRENSVCSFILVESTCPKGWITLNVSCYYFSNEAGSWDEARSDCIHRGADLLVMNNAEEKTFLAALFKKEAWIGLNDKETEGSWKWVDGTSPEFKNWHDSQPNNGGTSGRWGEEDCAHVYNNDKASWNDFSCDGAKHWICEKVLKLGV
uniref:C-type lectin domain family 17, member A-like n=1 Tax=Xiphophorus maculatus TaxID=8083 RepID=A0A3B5QVR0_XIPMA